MPKPDPKAARIIQETLARIWYEHHPVEPEYDYETHEILWLRYLGATWAQIGFALGISPQAAHKRYGNLPPQPTPPPEEGLPPGTPAPWEQ